MTYVSFFFITLGFSALMSQISKIKKLLAERERFDRQMFSAVQLQINELLMLQENTGEDINKELKEVTNSLVKICDALNETYRTAGSYMNFTTTALQHTLVCLRPFVSQSLNTAVDREDYKTAQECQRILDNIDTIINFTQYKQ